MYTKKSQWEKPTAPVFPVDENAPPEPPPGYEAGKNAPIATDTKKNPYENPTDEKTGTVPHGGASADEDAKLAAKLQAEEEARARGGPVPLAGYGAGGAADSYAQGHPGSVQQQQEPFPSDLPPRDGSRSKVGGGILGKLFGKGKNQQQGQAGYPGGNGNGYGGYSPQPQHNYYSSPPPQQYGGYPQQGPPVGGGYGGYPPQGYGQPGYGAPGGYYGGGGYPQGGYQQQPAGRKPGMGGAMGMGLAGGALGLGAGMLGGALIADAVHDHDQNEYMQGYREFLFPALACIKVNGQGVFY